MFRDPTPMGLWRDSILFWCRLTQANCDASLRIWSAFSPLVPVPAPTPAPKPARRRTTA
jgi:hypothetical protein